MKQNLASIWKVEIVHFKNTIMVSNFMQYSLEYSYFKLFKNWKQTGSIRNNRKLKIPFDSLWWQKLWGGGGITVSLNMLLVLQWNGSFMTFGAMKGNEWMALWDQLMELNNIVILLRRLFKLLRIFAEARYATSCRWTQEGNIHRGYVWVVLRRGPLRVPCCIQGPGPGMWRHVVPTIQAPDKRQSGRYY